MKYQTLQIFRPTISKNITQGWAENRACIDSNTGRIFGVSKGKRCPGISFYQSVGMRGHNGLDIATITGEEVYHSATYPGWWRSEIDGAGGIGVDVVSNEPLFFPMTIPTEIINSAVPHTQDGVIGFTHHVKMRNWHLYAPIGHERKQITIGTVIGQAGNTGASSGPHLHFAPKWCLPDGRGVGQTNGFTGAFDPTPYYKHHVTAKEHAEFLRKPVVPLSAVELKDMQESLNLVQRLLIKIQKLKNKI